MTERLDRLRRDVAAKPGLNRPSWGLRALTVMLECFETDTPSSRPPPVRAGPSRHALHPAKTPTVRIGVREGGGRVRVGTPHLERRFRGAGLPPVGRSIILQRIARAEQLLTETGIQIKEVAYACGFGGPQRMIYDFRRVRGTTPGASARAIRFDTAARRAKAAGLQFATPPP